MRTVGDMSIRQTPDREEALLVEWEKGRNGFSIRFDAIEQVGDRTYAIYDEGDRIGLLKIDHTGNMEVNIEDGVNSSFHIIESQREAQHFYSALQARMS